MQNSCIDIYKNYNCCNFTRNINAHIQSTMDRIMCNIEIPQITSTMKLIFVYSNVVTAHTKTKTTDMIHMFQSTCLPFESSTIHRTIYQKFICFNFLQNVCYRNFCVLSHVYFFSLHTSNIQLGLVLSIILSLISVLLSYQLMSICPYVHF